MSMERHDYVITNVWWLVYHIDMWNVKKYIYILSKK